MSPSSATATAERAPDPGSREAPGLPGRLVLRNTGIYTLGSILPQAMNVLLLPIFTRYLSRADYGVLNYTTAVSAFLFVLGTLSIHSYLQRHYFECRSEEARRRLFGAVFLFLLGFNLLLLAAGQLALPLAFDLVHGQVPFHPYIQYALILNAVECLFTVPLAYLRVRQEAGRFVTISVLRTVLATGLSLYFVVGLRLGVLGRYYGLLAEGTLALIVCLALVARIGRIRWDGAVVRDGLRFSWPLLPGALFLNITAVSDRLILERFVPLSELGLYALGATLASSLGFITSGAYRAIEPEVFRMSGEPEFAARLLLIKRILVVAILAVVLVLIGLSREVVAVLAAAEFQEARNVLSLLVIPLALQGFSVPVSCYLLSIRQTRRLPLIAVAGAAASLAGNLALVPVLGMYGAASTAALAALVTLLMYQARSPGIRWRFERDVARLAAVAALGFGISRLWTPLPVLTLGLKAGLAAGALALLGITGLRSRRALEALGT
jgi:O-antigen/teichoic acid export membrane protein